MLATYITTCNRHVGRIPSFSKQILNRAERIIQKVGKHAPAPAAATSIIFGMIDILCG